MQHQGSLTLVVADGPDGPCSSTYPQKIFFSLTSNTLCLIFFGRTELLYDSEMLMSSYGVHGVHGVVLFPFMCQHWIWFCSGQNVSMCS